MSKGLICSRMMDSGDRRENVAVSEGFHLGGVALLLRIQVLAQGVKFKIPKGKNNATLKYLPSTLQGTIEALEIGRSICGIY